MWSAYESLFTIINRPADYAPTTRHRPATICAGWCTALLWIVPAKAAGTWSLPNGELVLEQKFQMLGGTIKIDNRSVPIASGRVRGEEIYIRTAEDEYRGRISGDTMSGNAKNGGTWQASRRRR